MAKKKSKSKKPTKKAEPKKNEHPMPDGFWSQVLAVVLGLLLAPLIALGLLGVGGSLPVALSDGAVWLFGAGAVFVPIILFIMGIRIFRSETHKLPVRVYVGMFLLLSSIGAIQVVLSPDDEDVGGIFGRLIGGVVDALLITPLAILVLLLIIVISTLFIFKISIKDLLEKLGLIKTKGDKSDAANGDESAKELSEKGEFKLNEGVPIQKGRRSKEAPRQDDSKEALTTVTDPNWKLPGIDLLINKQDKADPGDIETNADIIKDTLAEFNIDVKMEGANVGPRVTQYTLRPPSGVRLSKITSLDSNLSLNLAAQSIRMEAPIPGKSAVGIEVPNIKAASVRIYDVLSTPEWKKQRSNLSFALGKDISGKVVIADLDSMPHLLVAGTTGSGKSVMINTILTSLLYNNSPSSLKLILIDPKLVELNAFDDIPHLLTPVINDPEKTLSAMKWAINEMERRYLILKEVSRKNIGEYNKLKKEETMPYIIIVVDELSDLMAAAARDLENSIVRLAQKSRAVGIHLILATQRPDANVITGLIKANVPSRIAFRTNDQINSRVIIDKMGAEKLLGKGDMLYKNQTMADPIRIQAALAETEEVQKVTDHAREQKPPEYDEEVITQQVQIGGGGGMMAGMSSEGSDDALYNEAVRVVIESGKASASLLQRRLKIGYGRAARLLDYMEEQGIVGPSAGSRPREVLVSSTEDVFDNEL